MRRTTTAAPALGGERSGAVRALPQGGERAARRQSSRRPSPRTGLPRAAASAVKEVASELGRTPAQVALAWTLHAPGVTAPVIGARTLAQLEDNLGALQVDLTPSHLARLNEVSAIDLGNPHALLASDHIRTVTTGDMKIETLG
ncbi:aldo/keto reductase [Streptomyces galbus]|uniref:aldo/keto reductase n=1 Tax=Streptomyces galbus TaxID=33898 RepID=UPI0028981EAE|nr:aldo/keto reductase [Streptomyces galbus]